MAIGLPARAQSAMPEVGFLHPGSAAGVTQRVTPFVQGLRNRGFIDGQSISVVQRFANFDRSKVDSDAAELVQRKVRAILAVGPQAVLAVRAITTSVPIVALDLESDPVKSGFAERLSRPGGNVTGLFFDFPDFSTKWLELLGETIPGFARLGVFWDPSSGTVQLDAVTSAAQKLGVKIEVLKVGSPAEMDQAFQTANDARSQAVLVLSSPIFGTIPDQVADAALRHRLATITLFPEFADAGGLMAYGINLTDLFRQAGEMVGKVLAGARPAEMPIERPSRFELVVNLKTAAALGIVIPQVVQLRADRHIE